MPAARRHADVQRPSAPTRHRQRADHPVIMTTNTTIDIGIENDGVIVIFSDGQHSSGTAPALGRWSAST